MELTVLNDQGQQTATFAASDALFEIGRAHV